MYQRSRMESLLGGGVAVRRVAVLMAAARKWNVRRSSRGDAEPGGAGAVRNGGGRYWLGRGWKFLGSRRKDKSFIANVGGGDSTVVIVESDGAAA
jgi:hypothetical protein